GATGPRGVGARPSITLSHGPPLRAASAASAGDPGARLATKPASRLTNSELGAKLAGTISGPLRRVPAIIAGVRPRLCVSSGATELGGAQLRLGRGVRGAVDQRREQKLGRPRGDRRQRHRVFAVARKVAADVLVRARALPEVEALIVGRAVGDAECRRPAVAA